MKKVLIIALVAAFLFSGCSAALQDSYKNVDAKEFEDQMTGNIVLVDVRTEDEYDEGHIGGAKLIPVGELEGRLDELEEYDKVLVYCHSGSRSAKASKILITQQTYSVYNLSGGIMAWNVYKSE